MSFFFLKILLAVVVLHCRFWFIGQMLTITLDESDCFAAWVSAKDAGFSSSDGSDPKRTSVKTLSFWLLSCRIAANVLILSPLPHTYTHFKVNLGGLLLQALLEFWPRTRINPMDEEENEVNHGEDGVLNPQASAAAGPRWLLLPVSQRQLCSALPWDCVLASAVNGEQENRVQKGNGYFQVPPHTPVIFGEAGGRTLFRYSRLPIFTNKG